MKVVNNVRAEGPEGARKQGLGVVEGSRNLRIQFTHGGTGCRGMDGKVPARGILRGIIRNFGCYDLPLY